MSEKSKQRNDARRLLKVGQVAERLGLSCRTIWALASTGELPRVRIGASVRFDERDVESLIERSREEPTGGAA